MKLRVCTCACVCARSRACSVYARYAGQANGGSLLLPPSLAKSTIPLQHFSSDPLQLDIQSAANEGDADRSVSQLALPPSRACAWQRAVRIFALPSDDVRPLCYFGLCC